MKKELVLLILGLISSVLIAQTPDAFKYQAVIRDSEGLVISNQNVSLQISILSGSTEGTVEVAGERTQAKGRRGSRRPSTS